MAGVQETEIRKTSAKFAISKELIDCGGFRLYSSDLTRFPIWGEQSLVTSHRGTAAFAVKRGAMTALDGVFVHLVSAKESTTSECLDVTLLVDESLQCDDDASRRLGTMLTQASRVLKELETEKVPTCSKEQMERLKNSGLLSFPNSGIDQQVRSGKASAE